MWKKYLSEFEEMNRGLDVGCKGYMLVMCREGR